ncbi:MAG: MFS transporter [Nitrososphaerota archaeon]|nr:MFS transporter [Nitrososphaerota archaeon]MDG6938908.1 MFS transporter [Nitrososphaerota archaeon]
MPDSILSAMDSQKMSKFHGVITVLAAMGVFLDGYDISIISVALLFIKPEFNTTPYELGLIGAATSLGMLFGAMAFGYMSDKFGRRIMFLWDLLFFVVFAILSALAQNTVQLIVFRFLLGIGLGADYALSTTIVAEFSPARSRGKLLAGNLLAWWVGSAVAYVTGLALLPLGAVSWRYMIALGVIPALAVIVGRKWLPESPRWLISHGQADKAAQVVERLTGKKVTPSEIESAYDAEKSAKVPVKELFSKSLIRSTAFVWGFWFAFDFVFYGIGIFTPSLLQALGLKGITAAVQASVFIAILEVCASTLSLFLMDRLGRRTITAVGFLVGGVALITLALIYPPAALPMLVLFPLYAFFLAFGPGTTDFVYSVELFPTRVRSTGQASSTAVSRVGAVISIFFFPSLLLFWGVPNSLIFFGIVGLLGFLVTLVLGVETKRKSLEEIAK